MTREELLTYYKITSDALEKLLNDLLSLPDTRMNRLVFQRALSGIYAKTGSPVATPHLVLFQDLLRCTFVDPRYERLFSESNKEKYFYMFPPQLVKKFDKPFDLDEFVEDAALKADNTVIEEEQNECEEETSYRFF
ncbi:hypothetical protein [Legionella shakespearei]|uniref:Uncharacterized protein n=1 Tax=Legionella shakespearei DSM 23087 TaxID=1122169 RepID=A0A0W0Z0Y4_9GAMM|nr:hypothetical protein [Legionella shakespearei]KTD62779.1 hypothetical protein Lsha_0811 [Legionella shakespearei DSM 23087]